MFSTYLSIRQEQGTPYRKKRKLPTSLPMGYTAMKLAARGLHMGILPCKLGYPLLPYMETVGSSVGSRLLPNMKKVGSGVGSGVGCPWEFCHANKAAHYFNIRI